MKNYRRVSALALLLLIAPAIPAIAFLCGSQPCPMAEASVDCMHMPSLEDNRYESREMDCCQNEGASISCSLQSAGECCTISDQDSPEAISQERIVSKDPLEISSSCVEVSAKAAVTDREFVAIKEKPRPVSGLFTLHSAFLI